MKGGYRPNVGRKKGSVPWNKGIPMREDTKEKQKIAHQGKIAWNKGKLYPTASKTMKGNQHGRRNKGRIFKMETLKRMRVAKLGKKESIIHRNNKRLAQYRRLLRENPNYVPSPPDKREKMLIVNGGFHSQGEWQTLKAQYNWTCPSCKLAEPFNQKYRYLTEDHIIPVSKGGSDNIENIQPLCFKCNMKKHTKDTKY